VPARLTQHAFHADTCGDGLHSLDIPMPVSRRQFCYQLVLIGAVVGQFVLVDFGTNAWDVTNRDAAIDDIDRIGQ